MSHQICYECERKNECYTQYGMDKIVPGANAKEINGHPCGAVFRNLDEAKAFINAIGDAIRTLNKSSQDKIIKQLTERYNTEEYFITSELFK